MSELTARCILRTGYDLVADALVPALGLQVVAARGRDEFFFQCGGCNVTCSAGPLSTCIEVSARDWRRLSLAKSTIAGCLERASLGIGTIIEWSGDCGDDRRLGHVQTWTVTRIGKVTQLVRRISFSVEDASLYEGALYHVRLLIPRRHGASFDWPVSSSSGSAIWPCGDSSPVLRNYTVRHVRTGQDEVDVDFVLHEPAGPASSWAASCRLGDMIGALGPIGRPLRPALNSVLIGDETALPAIARAIEATPGQKASVLLEVADRYERQPVSTAPGVSIHWLYRDRSSGPSIIDALDESAWLDRPHLFVYVGLELNKARLLSSFLTQRRGMEKQQFLSMAYWRAT